MIFAGDWQRQARGCARLAEACLAEACEDQHLAERLRLMAADPNAKADEAEDGSTERPRHVKPRLAPNTRSAVPSTTQRSPWPPGRPASRKRSAKETLAASGVLRSERRPT